MKNRKPSRCACFLAALRARRMASAFSRVLRTIVLVPVALVGMSLTSTYADAGA
jgi:hypothetical protein